jgi:hypothetical protein
MKISHYNTDDQAFKNALNLLGTSQENSANIPQGKTGS